MISIYIWMKCLVNSRFKSFCHISYNFNFCITTFKSYWNALHWPFLDRKFWHWVFGFHITRALQEVFFEERMKDGAVFPSEIGHSSPTLGICVNGQSAFVLRVIGHTLTVMNHVYFSRLPVMHANSKNISYDNVFHNSEILEFKMHVKYFL